MRKRYALICLLALLWSSQLLRAQDFLLMGCYWDCPDNALTEIDPAAMDFWISKVKSQAPALRHAGFSYLWLPSFYPEQQNAMAGLIGHLRQAGLDAVLDVDLYGSTGPNDSLRYPLEQVHRLWDGLQVRGFRLTAEREIKPGTIGRLLSRLEQAGQLPRFLVVRTKEKQSSLRLADFVNAVEESLAQIPELGDIDTRVFDYPLREALRRACTQDEYDVRQLYANSIRDASSLSGFKIVTLVNSPEFYNPNGIEGDQDDLIADPSLAYAYTLTNNQLGLPAVFYGDYFGAESEIDFYLEKTPLQSEIDQLLRAHREFIANSTSLEYLNQEGSERASAYLSGSPERSIIFQLDGANTAAGKSSGRPRDVLVAINFSDSTLRVVQEINLSNVSPGDRFTDVLGRSGSEQLQVGLDEKSGIGNSVYLELPPRSYSIWVLGKAERITTSPIDFSVEKIGEYVELSWEVADESSFRGYEIERSINGGPFRKLSRIDPLGSRGEPASYLFTDENIFPNEVLRYRVKAVGAKGKAEVSATRRVFIPEAKDTVAVHGETNESKILRIRSAFNDLINLSLYNSAGERVYHSSITLKKGINLTKLDLSKFPKGVYFIHYTSSRQQKWVQRLLNM